MVEFEEPPSLFEFMDLEDYLSKLLGLKIDLVTRGSLKPRIGEHVLREVVYLRGKGCDSHKTINETVFLEGIKVFVRDLLFGAYPCVVMLGFLNAMTFGSSGFL